MMSTIAMFNGVYCRAEEIVREVVGRTGFTQVSDDEIVRRASENSGVPEGKLARVFTAKGTMLNGLTRDRERSISHLRYALAERLLDDDLVVDGFCSHLIPTEITHVLRVCLIAEMGRRVEWGVEGGSLNTNEVARQIREADESAADWVMTTRGVHDPWNPELYDLLIPTDSATPTQAVDLIVDAVGMEAVRPTTSSKRAAEDFLVAARTRRVLAEHGHFVDVECASGAVTLTINKHVLLLRRLEKELKAIAAPVEGVNSVTTRVGKDFYRPDIYRDVEFEEPSRVLLVDDEREFVQTLSERLEMRDVGSAVAYDGESALRMVEDEEPDVIILDLRMPGIDGIEVLRRVKKTRPHIEVIILTGHGSEEDRTTCMELGAFAYLQKPVDIDVLSETLKQANQKAHASAHAGEPPEDGPE